MSEQIRVGDGLNTGEGRTPLYRGPALPHRSRRAASKIPCANLESGLCSATCSAHAKLRALTSEPLRRLWRSCSARNSSSVFSFGNKLDRDQANGISFAWWTVSSPSPPTQGRATQAPHGNVRQTLQMSVWANWAITRAGMTLSPSSHVKMSSSASRAMAPQRTLTIRSADLEALSQSLTPSPSP